MEETCAGDVGDRRAHLLPCVDDIDAEGVHGIAPTRAAPKTSQHSECGTSWLHSSAYAVTLRTPNYTHQAHLGRVPGDVSKRDK